MRLQQLELICAGHRHRVSLPMVFDLAEKEGLTEKLDELTPRDMSSIVRGML